MFCIVIYTVGVSMMDTRMIAYEYTCSVPIVTK